MCNPSCVQGQYGTSWCNVATIFITSVDKPLLLGTDSSSFIYRMQHKNNPLRKISQKQQNILCCFSVFNAEVVTYDICQFYRTILSKNKTMAVRIQKCILLSEPQLEYACKYGYWIYAWLKLFTKWLLLHHFNLVADQIERWTGLSQFACYF